jgi:hypothetical protein
MVGASCASIPVGKTLIRNKMRIVVMLALCVTLLETDLAPRTELVHLLARSHLGHGGVEVVAPLVEPPGPPRVRPRCPPLHRAPTEGSVGRRI